MNTTNTHLFLMLGLPGAGKTTLARQLCTFYDFAHIWANHERRISLEEPAYNHAENTWLYRQLNERVEDLLAQGQNVIYDTAFNFRSDRLKMEQLATRHNATTTIVWVDTPEHIARSRAVSYPDKHSATRVLGRMNDATFDSLKQKLEMPHSSEHFVRIDGSEISDDTLAPLHAIIKA